MSNESLIEEYLSRLAEGEGLIEELTGLLANEIVYTPVVQFRNLKDDRGTNVIRVASFNAGGRTLVPVFTSEDYFLEWSDGQHQCFSLAAADLALTLPEGSWLVIDPGKPHSLELSPEEVSMLVEAEKAQLSDPLDEPIPAAETFVPEESFDSIVDEEQPPVEDSGYDFDFADASTMRFGAQDEPSHPEHPASTQEEELAQRIYNILLAYPEVEEAYLHDAPGGITQAMLGLLTGGMDAERRFLLIDQIAEISREFFGTAGAIEVYDDLDVTTSSSWTLFSALNPFYVKTPDSSGLVIERERIPSDEEEEDEQSGSGLSWGRVRRKGSRLLGALVGK